MKQIFSILFLLLLISSCSGNDKTPGRISGFEAAQSEPVAHHTINTPKPDANAPLAEFVSCVLQDKSGNYWFATLGDGVCRYDGKTFTWFTVKNGLCDNYVWSIQEDKTLPAGETGIFFGTRNGVCRYDGVNIHPEKSGFTDLSGQYDLVHNFDFLYNVNQGKAWQSKPSDLWFGTTAGVYRYDGKLFTYTPLPESESDIKLRQTGKEMYSNPYSVYCTYRDKAGKLWFGTESRGVCCYDGKTFTWLREKGLDKAAVRAIYEDKNGTLWFGNNGVGVFRYDGKTLTNFTEERGLGNPDFLKNPEMPDKAETLARIWTITEDKTGNLWFGTVNAGAWKYDGKSLTNYTVKQGLKSNAVYDIYKDNTGNLWFATYAGGVCRYDGKSFIYLTGKGLN